MHKYFMPQQAMLSGSYYNFTMSVSLSVTIFHANARGITMTMCD